MRNPVQYPLISATNLEEFNQYELLNCIRLMLTYQEQGFPKGFLAKNVSILLDRNTDTVFYTNAVLQRAAVNARLGTLEHWYTLPYSRIEGFKEQLVNMKVTDIRDIDFINNL